jgi:hypothetical protein
MEFHRQKLHEVQQLADSTNYLNENVAPNEAKDLNLIPTTGPRVFPGAIDSKFAAEVSP